MQNQHHLYNVKRSAASLSSSWAPLDQAAVATEHLTCWAQRNKCWGDNFLGDPDKLSFQRKVFQISLLFHTLGPVVGGARPMPELLCKHLSYYSKAKYLASY